jgi:hypothetical protein
LNLALAFWSLDVLAILLLGLGDLAIDPGLQAV